MTSPAPASAALRAHMVRVAPAAAVKPKTAARRRDAASAKARAKTPAAGKGRSRRKVASRTARPKAAPAAAVASAAAPPIARPVPWAGQREAPPTYALISTTICGGGVAPVVPLIPLIPLPARANMLRSPDEATAVDAPSESAIPGPTLLTEAPFIPGAGTPLIPGPGVAPMGPSPMGAVPEPQTWALLIMGFGLIGAKLRRRRAVA